MRVAEAMTADPVCCSPETTAEEAASRMAENDCGCLPVVDSDDRVVGVVTDRDIACRCVGGGKDSSTSVSEVMTSQARCCGPEDDAQEAMRVMAEGQVRRVPVVDEAGCCVGMVSHADIARQLNDQVGHVVAGISEPTASSSQASQAGAGRQVGGNVSHVDELRMW